MIETAAIFKFITVFVDSLSLQQRAAILSISSPYLPDYLQVAAILLEA